MTLQERLRRLPIMSSTAKEAADALDAKDARIKQLEEALLDILATHANDNIRPKAFYIASAALEDK